MNDPRALTAEEKADLTAERARQGLPPTIEDRAELARIAELIYGSLKRKGLAA